MKSAPSIVVTDDRKRVWPWLEKLLNDLNMVTYRSSSTLCVPESADLIHNAPYIIVHWEAHRFGGSLVEEILEQHPEKSLDSFIILTTAPTREDIIYFSELSMKNIIHIRWLDSHLAQAQKQLVKIIQKQKRNINNENSTLQQIRKHLRNSRIQPEALFLENLEEQLLQPNTSNAAAKLDTKACLLWLQGQHLEAQDTWERAHIQNPQYPHILEHQFLAFRQQQDYKMARHILKKLHQLNKNRASRWVELGTTHLDQDNLQKAEGCFTEAMQRDPHNQRFILTLANLKFLGGEYDTAKKLASKATSTKELASLLNSHGIEMVRRGEYEAATNHYEKALLILKNDQKSASIFYNLSLCLYRQGQYTEAAELAKVTLIKEPDHEKALRLLSNLHKSS